MKRESNRSPDAGRVRISITTATLNAASDLPGCIESVAGQAGRAFEVEHVVADGGSSDATVAIAEAAGCVVIQGRDRGLYDALNKATGASTGEVIGCLGADDRLAAGALGAVARWYAARRHPWSSGSQRWVDGEGRPLGTTRPPPSWMTPSMYASLGWSCFDHQATFMTRGFFDELGGFDPDLRCAGDYDLFARALRVEAFDRIPAVLAEFRMSGVNLSAPGGERFDAENRAIASTYGPRSGALRRGYRLALRVWLNARNPSWFAYKRLRPEAYGRVP